MSLPPLTINGRDSIACVVFVYSVIEFTHALCPDCRQKPHPHN
jgi:hypothetical protein